MLCSKLKVFSLSFSFFLLFSKSHSLYSQPILLKSLLVNKGAYLFFVIANPFGGGGLIIDCCGCVLALIL
jgi:hypothetical protein